MMELNPDSSIEIIKDYIILINDSIQSIDNTIPTIPREGKLISELNKQKETLIQYRNTFQSRGGNGNTKIIKINKKEILGRVRCIYKKAGDRKEYVKHKGDLITVRDFKSLKKHINQATIKRQR
jgi:hypothetical protein